jgi:cytochrome c
MIGTACLALLVGLASFAAAAAQQAGDAEQVAFNNHCRTCHSTKSGDNRLGPSLHGIVGAKAGQVAGFRNYSASMKADITWDEATLDRFIANPDSVTPNHNMKPFTGVADAGERARIIAFLKQAN